MTDLDENTKSKMKKQSWLSGIKNLFSKNESVSKKIKFVIVGVLCLIVILIFLSSFFPKNSKNLKTLEQAEQSVMDYAKNTELRLQQILSGVAGIGNVKVFVYVSSSPEVVYKEDTETVTSGSNVTTTVTTIFDKNGTSSSAVVVVTKYPKIEGVLIVAGGAGDAMLKLKIIDAVSCVLSIAPTNIEVLEGKS
ncbi:MAG: hypothetical protein IJW24_01465 [Clostridia bacterium]|nr:hypothetical protein [Clostridia bacterium]